MPATASLQSAWNQFVSGWHKFLHRWSVPITFASLFVVFVVLSLISRSLTPPQKITFLTGPKGSVGVRLGETLGRYAEAPPWWRFWEPRNTLTVVETKGFEDNRQRIDRNASGTVVAFGHDGFNPTENIRVLLPLSDTHLHIVASNELLNAIGWIPKIPQKDGPQIAPTFSSLLAYLPKKSIEQTALASEGGATDGQSPEQIYESYFQSQVFLGPKLSGTRQAAELVLDHLNVDVAKIDRDWELDWEQMLQAFDRGEIHLGFFLGEPSSGLMRRFGERGRYRLLSWEQRR